MSIIEGDEKPQQDLSLAGFMVYADGSSCDNPHSEYSIEYFGGMIISLFSPDSLKNNLNGL